MQNFCRTSHGIRSGPTPRTGRRFTRQSLLEDLEIRKRLNHMVMALRMLTALARGETPDPPGTKDIEPTDQLEAALGKANAELIEALNTVDLEKLIVLPRVRKARGKHLPKCYYCRQSRTVNIIAVRTHPECGNWAPLRQ